MALAVAFQELHGDAPTPAVPEVVFFESPSPVSRTLSHDRVFIGHPVYSRHCANRQQCTVEETQLKESVFSWGTQCGKCHHCRDKDWVLHEHLGVAAAQLFETGLPERGDIKARV